MRILQVSSHYPPSHTGGAERVCQSLSAVLAASGHEVQVAAPVPESREGGVRVRSLPGGAPRPVQKLLFDYTSPRASAALLRIVDEFQPDVVHVHNVYGIGSRVVRAASLRAPTVVTLHDYWPMDIVAPQYLDGELSYPPRGRMMAAWRGLHRRWHAAQLSDARLVSPSRFLAQRVGQVLRRDIDVITNGLHLPREQTVGERRMLFVGRLVPEKGLDGVLPAMVDAALRHGWEVDVAGEGPLRAKLAQHFPSVRWHGRVDPAPLYRSASVLVVPSIWPENAPVVVLEGMAHGLAVIAAASGGIPELVREGESGLLYPPGDVRAFTLQLERLIADEGLRAATGKRARADVGVHDWRAIAPRYLGLYANACDAWNARDGRRSWTPARAA